MSLWPSVTWDVARAGGFTAYILMMLSVAVGLALTMHWQSPKWPRLINSELHNFLALLGTVFIGIHVLAVWVDPFTRFGWAEVFLPFVSHYRPLWMAFGIIALYLGIAIGISTWLRPWIGYKLWRGLHVLTLLAFILVTIHGIATGSDTRTWWGVLIYGGSVLIVGSLLWQRLIKPTTAKSRSHPVLATAVIVVTLIGTLWTLLGPLQPGWNTTANNGQGSGGSTVLAAANGSASSKTSPSSSSPFAPPFTAQIQGTLTQSGPDSNGNVTLMINSTLSQGASGVLQITLQGQAGGDDGSLNITNTHVVLGTNAQTPLYSGPLTTLNADRQWRMTAQLTGMGTASGQLNVSIDVRVNSQQQVSGTIQGLTTSAPGSSGGESQ
ncbi:MAG TPA: hypothetical protein VNG51_16790 [Ktedonobacteraceae bacterium]|nr:hypothetical protein [Ktedonobacteraceae bacterium]